MKLNKHLEIETWYSFLWMTTPASWEQILLNSSPKIGMHLLVCKSVIKLLCAINIVLALPVILYTLMILYLCLICLTGKSIFLKQKEN